MNPRISQVSPSPPPTPTILLNMGCCDKLPRTTRLKNQTLHSHGSEGWAGQDPGASQQITILGEGPFPGVQTAPFSQ